MIGNHDKTNAITMCQNHSATNAEGGGCDIQQRHGYWQGMNKLILVLTILLMPSMFAGSAWSRSFMTTTDLGTLGGTNSFATAINNMGQVVGSSDTATGESHGFIWQAGVGMKDLGTLGSPFINPRDINAAGQVTGFFETPIGLNVFLWQADTGIIDLGTLGGTFAMPADINDVGQIVGQSETTSGELHPFLWQAKGGMIDLGAFETNCQAEHINNSGLITGFCQTDTGLQYPVLWQFEKQEKKNTIRMTDLRTVGLANVWDINNAGQIVGYGPDSHAVLWQKGVGAINLGTLGTFSSATTISNNGLIAGVTDSASSEIRAVLWQTVKGRKVTTRMTDLGSMGGTYTFPTDINNAGQIVGFSNTASDEYHGFLWQARVGIIDLGITSFTDFHINEGGKVIGAMATDQGIHAFVWTINH